MSDQGLSCLNSIFIMPILNLTGSTSGLVTTVKPVLSSHSKIYKTKVLMENGS